MGLGLDKRDQIESEKFYVCILDVLIHQSNLFNSFSDSKGKSYSRQVLAPKDLKFAGLLNYVDKGVFVNLPFEYDVVSRAL